MGEKKKFKVNLSLSFVVEAADQMDALDEARRALYGLYGVSSLAVRVLGETAPVSAPTSTSEQSGMELE